jgi:hypothetical protein
MGYFYMGTVEFECYWAAYHARRSLFAIFDFNDGTMCRIDGAVHRDDDRPITDTDIKGGWFVTVCPSEVTGSGISDVTEAQRADEFANVFYGLLKNVSSYRFAAVGVEVAGIRSYEDVVKELGEKHNFWPGMVISEELWKGGGSPDLFVPFHKGYRWRPFESEVDIFKRRHGT